MLKKAALMLTMAGFMMMLIAGSVFAADDMQKQITDIRDAMPKFAIPMREVGDRFQNMYFAAKGGNWGLAYYMSKYMNGAMNPAKVTKPAEYPAWANFYNESFAPVNKAIFARDFKAFDKAYMGVIKHCNDCHAGMGYSFIKVVKMKAPADNSVAYTGKSKAEDVPK